ncbi:MAG: orotidine-5'-phosphate decarboxylase [Acidobacteriota bacterium]
MKQAVVPERLIIALDVDSSEKAINLVKQLPEAEIFKVGLKLFTREGPLIIKKIQSLRKNVFLDLKLHDIPNTVAGAVAEGVRMQVAMMTLHASGGKEMMKKTVSTAIEESEKRRCRRPLLLAVTILTSLDKSDLDEIGFLQSPSSAVLRLTDLARQCNMDGVVCSPQEVELIRQEIGKEFLIVTPGIRPSWSETQDQKRFLTPAQAIQKGSDYLVLGRPVTAAPHPGEAFQRILKEIRLVSKLR